MDEKDLKPLCECGTESQYDILRSTYQGWTEVVSELRNGVRHPIESKCDGDEFLEHLEPVYLCGNCFRTKYPENPTRNVCPYVSEEVRKEVENNFDELFSRNEPQTPREIRSDTYS